MMSDLYTKNKEIFQGLNIPAFDCLSEIFSSEREIHSFAFSNLLTEERRLFSKYQFINYSEYKTARIKYIQNCGLAAECKEFILDYLQTFVPKIGLYAGSFNPFHKGHLNIVEKAEKIFDKVIIAQGINPGKTISESQLNLSALGNRQCEVFKGFLTEFVSEIENCQEITIIRGLRNGYDLDYEINQLRFMEDMKDNLQVIFISCDKQYEHISSTSLRNLERIEPGFSNKYLP